MSQGEKNRTSGTRTYTNGMLTVIAVLLGVVALEGVVGLPALNEAQAQRNRRSSERAEQLAPPNAASQRARMIAELEKMSERLSAIETKLEGPFEVKVTEMPESAMSNVFNPNDPQR